MTEDEAVLIVSMVRNTVLMAKMLTLEQTNALLNQSSREHTLMPMLDPTTYKKQSKRIEEQADVFRAFYEFRAAIEGKDL